MADRIIYNVVEEFECPDGFSDFDNIEMFYTREEAENFISTWIKNGYVSKGSSEGLRIIEMWESDLM